MVMLGVLAAGFIYLRALGRRLFFDVSKHAEEAVRARLNEAALQPGTGAIKSVTLYFPSPDQVKLLQESRPIPMAASETDRIRQILLALIEGPHSSKTRALSPSTDIRAVFLDTDGTAYLDFSNTMLADFTPGIASETLVVYSIVNSLAANIPTLKRVKILLQGQEVETLDGHADLSGFFAPDPNYNAPGS